MSIAATLLIALATALFGAAGYLWQKRIDAADQRRAVRRQVYEDYIASARAAEAAALWQPDTAVQAADAFSGQQELLFLYAPPDVVTLSQKLDTAFYAWRASLARKDTDKTRALYDEVAKLKAQVKLAMRSDLLGDATADMLPFLQSGPPQHDTA